MNIQDQLNSPVIDIQNVKKNFGQLNVINGVSLKVKKGECLGLLGANGAGKSTLISLLYGLRSPTSGDIKVFGMHPEKEGRQIRSRLGLVTQDNALDECLNVMENMLIYAAFMGVPKSERLSRVNELLKYMLLENKHDQKISSLSGGMKRRLVFVRALLANPDLVILDEPTTGLDPAVRHLLWNKVNELKELGKTILLTTHYIHEAEALCDRVVVMDKGTILDQGTPKDLIQNHVPISFKNRPANLEDVFLKLSGRGIHRDD